MSVRMSTQIGATLVALAMICTRVTLAAEPPAAPPGAGQPLIRSARSGPWSTPSTWEGGKVPGAGARVQIRAGHTIRYDLASDQAIRSIHLAGTFTFARDRNTRLDVGLIKIQAGEDASENGFDCDAHLPPPDASQPRPTLDVGTAVEPIAAGHTARIRLVYFEGMDKQSCPALVCCGGRMELHGAPMSRTWVKLGATVNVGETTLMLAEPVTGWRVGDRVIITATRRELRERGTFRPTVQPVQNAPGAFNPEGVAGQVIQSFTEERTIQAINGAALTLDRPLAYHHLGSGDYRGEVADLSRNVIVESADPSGERGHTMYHRGSAGSISYAEFRHLGKEGVLGRYSLHFHLVGNTMRGSSVVGASIWDSGNRWLTIHGTNYLVVRDCVGYGSIGHGFYLEDGTEVYNVLDRNLAVQAYAGKPLPKQNLPFDRNDGAGFWWANSLNSFTRNVACECDRYGYRFEATPSDTFDLHLQVQQPDGRPKATDIRTLPFVRFEGNEAHSEVYGFNLGEGVGGVGPDARHPFVIRDTRIWNVHWAFRPNTPSVAVEKMAIYGSRYGVYRPTYDHHAYAQLTIDQTMAPEAFRADGSFGSGERPAGLEFPQPDQGDRGPARAVTTGGEGDRLRERAEAEKQRRIAGGDRAPEGATPLKVRGGELPAGQAPQALRGPGPQNVAFRQARIEDPMEAQPTHLPSGPFASTAFPSPLDPVDDLPPATVITFVGKPDHGKLAVRGTTSDNGTVARVLVNGLEAKALAPNFAEWEITLDHVRPGALQLAAHAEDAAGNVEKLPHELLIRLP